MGRHGQKAISTPLPQTAAQSPKPPRSQKAPNVQAVGDRTGSSGTPGRHGSRTLLIRGGVEKMDQHRSVRGKRGAGCERIPRSRRPHPSTLQTVHHLGQEKSRAALVRPQRNLSSSSSVLPEKTARQGSGRSNTRADGFYLLGAPPQNTGRDDFYPTSTPLFSHRSRGADIPKPNCKLRLLHFWTQVFTIWFQQWGPNKKQSIGNTGSFGTNNAKRL